MRLHATHSIASILQAFRSAVLTALFFLAAFIATNTYAGPTLWTFSGDIVFGSGSNPSCPGLCGHQVPPTGNPISFTMVLDQPEKAEVFSEATSLVTWYTMFGGYSKIDFGYRPEFLFSRFVVSVKDNDIANSEPDQLLIFKHEPICCIGESSFSLHLGSMGTSLIDGSALPSNLDLALTNSAFGRLTYVTTGAGLSEYADFTINRLVVSSVPEPQSLLLMLTALGALVLVHRRTSLRIGGSNFALRWAPITADAGN